MSRFDYVKYDSIAEADQLFFKNIFMELDVEVSKHVEGRAKSLVITQLEVCYMWIGKMIRDEQIKRTGKAELQEARSDS